MPPPPQPAGLCLVDTGVNVNPDTESAVVERIAIDGGSGNDASPEEHGTVLAMMAAAPRNGWGMVGTAPTATRIISVRILEPGQTTFPFAYYTDGISTCLQRAREYNMKVINLSLGNNETPSSQDYEALSDAIERANNYGVAVVAAAGNDNGGPLDYPAAYPSVLSVGASDTVGGALCSFSNRGEGLRLLAPGCDLDGANPMNGEANYNYWQGSSEASDIAADALDALDAYRPELTVQAAEEDLTSAQGGELNIAQSFRDAGLSEVVAAGEAAEPATPAAASVPSPPAGTSQTMLPTTTSTSTPGTSVFLERLARPRAKLTRNDKHLVLVLQDRPPNIRIEVRLLGHHKRSRHLVVLHTLTSSSVTIPLCTGTVKIEARYIDPYDLDRTSEWTTLLAPEHKQQPKRRP